MELSPMDEQAAEQVVLYTLGKESVAGFRDAHALAWSSCESETVEMEELTDHQRQALRIFANSGLKEIRFDLGFENINGKTVVTIQRQR